MQFTEKNMDPIEGVKQKFKNDPTATPFFVFVRLNNGKEENHVLKGKSGRGTKKRKNRKWLWDQLNELYERGSIADFRIYSEA